MRRVVVVGASLAGIRAAEALRRRGFDAELTVVGTEPGPPYRRPALSKGYLIGTQAAERIRLVTDAGLDVFPATEAIGLDLRERRVFLSPGGGPAVARPFDGMVIATGAVARTLPGLPLAGAYTLRTRQDAEALRAALLSSASARGKAGRRLVVVGGGLVGSEVAAAARSLGLAVTLVSRGPGPMTEIFGPEVGRMIARLHEAHGTRFVAGAATRLEGDDRVRAVRLAVGTAIPADIVLVAIGTRPATDWLAGSGLLRPDGSLRPGPNLSVADQITAAGDVITPAGHWDSAARQAETAARTLLEGRSAPAFNEVTMFWSGLYGSKLQMIGCPSRNGPVEVAEGSLEEGRCVLTYGEGTRTTGVLLINSPHRIPAYRPLLAAAAA